MLIVVRDHPSLRHAAQLKTFNYHAAHVSRLRGLADAEIEIGSSPDLRDIVAVCLCPEMVKSGSDAPQLVVPSRIVAVV
jgi:hypothetical protein